MSTVPSHVPELFRGLVDDAALFPPGNAPAPVAVRRHAELQRSPLADLVGPFVVGEAALGDVAEAASPELFPDRLSVALVVPIERLEAAVATLPERLRLAATEVKVDETSAAAVASVAAVRGALGLDVPVYVELPRVGRSEEAEEALASRGLRLKLRTGGATADAFPDEAELAAAIVGAVGAGVAFKCTAGLHNAVRHRDPETGFEHHGFLNVLAATADALAGADRDAVAARLAERDGAVLLDAISLGPDPRTAFLSYGSCSVTEPADDLTALGVLA